MTNTKPVFHGSDIEKISEYYHIDQNSITNFAGNVNPLGLSPSVKEAVAAHVDLFSSYPDRDYKSLRNTIAEYCDVPADFILKVSEVGLIAILNYKDFNVQADTLKNEYALVSLEDSNNKIWAINGYVNVPFTFKTKEQLNMNDFHLYAVEAKEDTLVTRLRQTKGADDAYQTGGALISFHMPFNDMEFRDIFDQVVPKSDTIVVKVTAKGENDKELVSTVKCSASNMQGSY